MKQINREEWAESISKYINKYLEGLYNAQIELKNNGESEAYNNFVSENIKMKENLLECINSMENFNYLQHE